MNRLEDLTLDDLHGILAEVEGKKPTLRVVVGINYKAGISPAEIARWYDVSRTTVYNWLDRLERAADGSPASALPDAERSGRPPKLSPVQRRSLAETVAAPPRAVGIDADEWTPPVFQRYIEQEFGIRFTRRHARTLLATLR